MEFVTTRAQVRMPCLLYGTAWKKERTEALVIQAIKCGFRGIDTACQPKHYNEAGVGQALYRVMQEGLPRHELFIQTKFTPLAGQDPFNIPYDKHAPLQTQVMQSFEASKKNLQLTYVDSLVLHSPLADFDALMQVWQAMEKVYSDGGAKQLGISNCYDLKTLQRLNESATVKPAVLQNRFYQDTEYDADLRKWCQKQSIIYQSFWSLTANPHLLESQQVSRLAASLKKTPAQVFFRFLTQMGIVPLTGTSSERHMQEDLAIFDFKLAQAQVQEIAALL